MLDLDPAAREVVRLTKGVTDEHLAGPTPCADTSVATLLDHLMQLSVAFTGAAVKTVPPEGGGSATEPGRPSGDHLDPAWRSLLPQRLGALAEAWRAPAAWEGMTEAGGVTMPAEEMGVVALDELVLHGWDLAQSTGQSFSCDSASIAAVLAFTSEMARPENAASREGLFGPVVDVADGASDLDRVLGFAGRNPTWSSGTGSLERPSDRG